MSAQDDVVAAFGEMPKWPREEEPVGDGEDATDGEAAEVGVSAQEPIGAASEPDQGTDADEPTEDRHEAEPGGQDAVGEPSEADQNTEVGEQDTSGRAGESSPSAQADALADPGERPQAGEHQGTSDAVRDAEVAEAAELPAAVAEAPYLDPSAFFAQLQAESAPTPRPRWPRLLLRYASALVVAGAVGAGTAYAVTLPQRTDVPFLATPTDGRYTFPAMLRPAPPAGKPAPGADSNVGQVHYNDLRQYLVSVPLNATAKEDGWEPVADFESAYSSDDVTNHLYDAGLRHIARRGWVAPDGQHTVIELLQFPDHQAAFSVKNLLDPVSPTNAHQAETVMPDLNVPSFGDENYNVPLRRYDQIDGLTGQKERRVVFGTGDVVAIITSTAPASVPDTATEQVVSLEAEMLR